MLRLLSESNDSGLLGDFVFEGTADELLAFIVLWLIFRMGMKVETVEMKDALVCQVI